MNNFLAQLLWDKDKAPSSSPSSNLESYSSKPASSSSLSLHLQDPQQETPQQQDTMYILHLEEALHKQELNAQKVWGHENVHSLS